MQRHGGPKNLSSPLHDTPDGFNMPGSNETLLSISRFWFLGNAGHPNAGAGCKIRPCGDFNDGSFGPSQRDLKKRKVDYKETCLQEHSRLKVNKDALTAMKTVMRTFEEAVLVANAVVEESADNTLEPVDMDSPMTEEVFKTVFELGIGHLKTNVIPHVYSNSKSQNRFGQCKWMSFHTWLKPSAIMKTGNASACRHLAQRITESDAYDHNSAAVLKKLKLTVEQLQQLENGERCKQHRSKRK